MRDGIFVSYSHADQDWLEQLQLNLRELPAEVAISLWSDRRILPAAHWQSEIDQAITTAAAAVLLLSPSFFNSPYIIEHELPPLLAAARQGEIAIFPVILSACDFAPVSEFQAVNDPHRPLSTLDTDSRIQVWQRLSTSLCEVSAGIGDEKRIGAEFTRLAYDVAAAPTLIAVNHKLDAARADPVFNENEKMRANTLAFLEGQRCQAAASWLMEESLRADLTPARRTAINRMLREVAAEEERQLQRVTEYTRDFANDTLATLQAAKLNYKQ
jgi:hypothetical protein